MSCATRMPRLKRYAVLARNFRKARLCVSRQHYAAAARFFRDAFAAQPELADFMLAGSLRYDAACYAALAGCGHGKDADKLDDKERALWRKQALDWLRKDLTWWNKALDRGNDAQTCAKVQGRMQHWQADSDLAGLREPGALELLSGDERKEWLALWKDVDALLHRATRP